MLGFVVGTVCAIGLARLLFGHRHGHWRHHHHHRFGHGGCGRGCGPDRYDRYDRFDRFDRSDVDDGFDGGRGDGGPVLLRGLFARLRTTPGQERVIADAFAELKAAWQKSRDERKQAGDKIADAVGGAQFSTDDMGGAFAHIDSSTEAMRDALFSALAKVHDALDERQRKILADLLRRRSWLDFVRA